MIPKPLFNNGIRAGRLCRLWLIAAQSLLLWGQQQTAPPGPSQTTGDGLTPAMLAPGSPAGSYELSGFDTLNLGTGHVNFTFPLATAYGRGGMKVPMVLNLQGQWTIYSSIASCQPASMETPWCAATAYSYAAHYGPRYPSPTLIGGMLQTRESGANCTYIKTANETWWQQMLTTVVYIAPDGTETVFLDTTTGGAVGNYPTVNSQTTNRGTTFRAVDGSAATVTTGSPVTDLFNGNCPSASTGIQGTMTLRDGTTYYFDQFGYATKIEDRNGNFITISDPLLGATNVTDAVGRSITTASASNANTSSLTVNYPGYEDAQRSVVVSSAETAGPCSGTGCAPTVNTVNTGTTTPQSRPMLRQNQGDSGTGTFGIETFQQLFPVVTTEGYFSGNFPYEILLPDYTAYEIYYDPAGSVSRVELPTGGAYEYDYTYYVNTSQMSPQPAWAQTTEYMYSVVPYLTEKRIYSNTVTLGTNSGSILEQVICYPSPINGTYLQQETLTVKYSNTAKCPSLLGSEDHQLWSVNLLNSPNPNVVSIPTWLEGRETQVTFKDPNNNPLKIESNTWQQRACGSGPNGWDQYLCWFTQANPTIQNCTTDGYSHPNSATCPSHDPQLQAETTTYNGVTSQNTYTYDAYDNQTQETESAYGANGNPGSVVRVANTAYNTASAYLNLNIVNLPINQTVATVGGPTVAQTQWQYDQNTLATCAGTQNDTGHGTVRGNATSIIRWWDLHNQNLTTQQSFDQTGNLVTVIDPRGVRKDLSYADSASKCVLPISITHYLGLNVTPSTSCSQNPSSCLTETLAYDYNILKPTQYTDFNGKPTTLAYADALDRLTNVTRPDGGKTSYTYTDTIGTCSQNSQSQNCFSVRATQDLDSSQKLKSQTDYDGLGRKVLSWYLAPEGEIDTTYTYDWRGRLATQSNPGDSSSLTTYTYDFLDRTLSVQAPDQSLTSYMYYGDGVSLANTKLEVEPPAAPDQNGNNRLYYYDAQGRLVRVDENVTSWRSGSYGQSTFSTYTTAYAYDVLDDLVQSWQNCTLTSGVCSSGGQKRSFSYDSLKHLVQSNNPEAGSITYDYDTSGNLLTRTDQRWTTCFGTLLGSTCGGTYDGLNRVVNKSQTDPYTAPVTYAYGEGAANAANNNVIGRLTQVTSASVGSIIPQFVYDYAQYDWAGRPLSSSQQIGTATPYTMSYGYDLAGKMTSFTFPSGRQQTIAYDSAGRAKTVSGAYGASSATYADTFTWFPNGALNQVSLGSGFLEQYCQNSRLQITGVRLGLASSGTYCQNGQGGSGSSGDPLVLNFSYGSSRYNNGNVTSQTIVTSQHLNVTQNYTYDAYDRLASAAEGSFWLQTYGYDAYGNRWVDPNHSTGITLMPFTPLGSNYFDSSNNNRLSFPSSTGVAVSYDLTGNLTGIGGSTYTYDAENRQISSSAGGDIFMYDGESRRVEKISGSTTTVYVYDATGEEVAEYSSSPSPTSGTLYLTADSLGSTRITTGIGSDGTQQFWYHDYLPFGEEIASDIDGRGSNYAGNEGVSHRFTGKERDAETVSSGQQGLDYFGARYFSGAQGRFTSPDPLGGELANPQSLNRYAYALNNPLRFTDPTGMYVCKDDPKDGSSHCASDQDVAFEKSVDAMRNSKNKEIARAAAAYGKANDANGVTVGFADLGKAGEGGVTRSTLGADANGKLFAQSDVTINSGSAGTALAADIGHEGSHVADAQDMVKGITITGGGTGFTVGVDISQYASEQRAYRVTDAIYRSANEPYNGCGNANCALGAGSSPIGIGGRIDQILLANPQLYHSADGKPLTQKNQGGNVLNLVVPH